MVITLSMRNNTNSHICITGAAQSLTRVNEKKMSDNSVKNKRVAYLQLACLITELIRKDNKIKTLNRVVKLNIFLFNLRKYTQTQILCRYNH